MLDKKNFVALAKTVAKANPSAPTAYSYNGQNFSYEELNETLRNEFKEIAGTYQLYRENKNLVFSIIEETLNDVLPQKVVQNYGQVISLYSVERSTEQIVLSSSLQEQDLLVTMKSSSLERALKALKFLQVLLAEQLRLDSKNSLMVVLILLNLQIS